MTSVGGLLDPGQLERRRDPRDQLCTDPRRRRVAILAVDGARPRLLGDHGPDAGA